MEKKETLEEFGARFKSEWTEDAVELLKFVSTDPFKKLLIEVEEAVEEVLRRHFTGHRQTTIKSLVAVALVGRILSEWTKKGSPLDETYRKLLLITAKESALGYTLLRTAEREGVTYTNDRLMKVMHLMRTKLRIVPQKDEEST